MYAFALCTLLVLPAIGQMDSPKLSARNPPMPREARDKVEDLKQRGRLFHDQGALLEERDARRALLEILSGYREANDPEMRLRQVMLNSCERVLELSVDQQAKIAAANRNLAKAVQDAKPPELLEAASEAEATYAQLLGKEDYAYLYALSAKITALSNQASAQHTLDLCQEVLTISIKLLGEEHPEIADRYGEVARFCVVHSQWDTAAQLFERMEEIRLKHDLPYDEKYVRNLAKWTETLIRQGKYPEAQQQAQRMIAVTIASPDRNVARRLGYLRLAESLYWQKQYLPAQAAFEHGFYKCDGKQEIILGAQDVEFLRQYVALQRQIGNTTRADRLETEANDLESALAARKNQQ